MLLPRHHASRALLFFGVLPSIWLGESLTLRVKENREVNQTGVTDRTFQSCNRACHQCFADHYQGCLAYCSVGCEDYCETKLPAPECTRHSQWTAIVAHVFQAMDPKARMCVSTGINGCPMNPAVNPDEALPPASQPYGAAEDRSRPVLACDGAEDCKQKEDALDGSESVEGRTELMDASQTAMDPLASAIAAAQSAQLHSGSRQSARFPRPPGT
eukprot:TRINITY_DN103251_c0_g1_i1.p2 TRINITY_DN103251_c0_g1~~TRINITY_DN103251_c0_g1_i1.p2  ORF type:complete len:215 (-),score=24.44 TRINITY_DN103251_c0_g1_i1:17-661(-)